MTTRPDPLADALRDALDEEGVDAEDDALLARAVARASERLEAAEPAPVVRLSERARAKRRRTLRFVVPIAAAFAASIAMAATVIATREPDHRRVDDTAKPSTQPAPPNTEPKASTPSIAAPDTTPSISVSDLPNVKVPTSAAPGAPAIADAPPASDLFRDANAARRAGDVREAVTLYRKLQQAHPASAESQASRVSLGRLLLDKEGDAAGALAQFDAYLASEATDGALSEEARVGRALALQNLGRKDAERRAWEDLVARHPQSLSVTRAKARLAELANQ